MNRNYDIAKNQWGFIGNSPLAARSRMVSMLIGNQAFIGFGWSGGRSDVSYKDFWQLDLIANTWKQIQTPFTKPNPIYATSFVLGNSGYLIGIENSARVEVWKFDASNNSWSKKSDFPNHIYGEAATTINDHGLVISSAVNKGVNDVYEYDPSKDLWITRQSLGTGTNGTTARFQFASYLNGKLYYASGNLWELSFN